MMRTIYLFLACIISSIASAQIPKMVMVQVATGFSNPVDIKNCGDERIFVVEQAGYIRIMDKKGNLRPTPFLDIRNRVNAGSAEQGLLSVAFSPNYKHNGYLYVNYNAGSGAGTTRIARFQVSAVDSNHVDSTTEKVILEFTQPFTNHKGGSLQFGNDGYLYDAQGDGGSSGDPNNNAQNTNSYLGKILRLDVSNPDTTYTIPSTNPFYGQSGVKQEIWSYGLRNPWRTSFDRVNHDFWIGDVGQGLWEEIDFQSASSVGGENYGWKCYEGNHTYGTCTPAGVTAPVFEYSHAYGGCSVTGGYIYRGAQYSRLWGLYLCVDYCSGKIWSVKQTSPSVFDVDSLQTFMANQHSTFGEDNNGELYLTARSLGRIYRITDTTSCKPVAFISLNDTIEGCNPVSLQALQGDSLGYQWMDATGDISAATSPQYNADRSGWYRVKVSKPQQGCEAISDSVYVLVHDTTALVVNALPDLCINSGLVQLGSMTAPSGGLFSGTAVRGTSIDPKAAGMGTTTILYTLSNQFRCVSNRSFSLVVNDTSVLTRITADTSFCTNSNPISLTAFVSPIGGSYSGNGIIGNQFSPDIAGSTNAIIYTYSNANSCVSVTGFNIRVNDTTAIEVLTGDTSVCVGEVVNLNNFVSPDSGVFSIASVVVSPQFFSNNSGSFDLLYQYDDGACISNSHVKVNVFALPVLTENLPVITYCLDGPAVSLDGLVTPTGGSYSGSGVANNSFLPAAGGPGQSRIVYNYTDNQGCTATDTFTLTVSICTGIDETNSHFSFRIYPNPASDYFNLATNVQQPATICIIDALGQVCYEMEIQGTGVYSTHSIRTATFAKGIYSIRLNGVNGSLVKRMIVN